MERPRMSYCDLIKWKISDQVGFVSLLHLADSDHNRKICITNPNYSFLHSGLNDLYKRSPIHLL